MYRVLTQREFAFLYGISIAILLFLPAVSFYLFVYTGSVHQQFIHLAVFILIVLFSFITRVGNTNRERKGWLYEDVVVYVWRGLPVIYISLIIWNYIFVRHIEITGYTQDIFREVFWFYFAPFYGSQEQFDLYDVFIVVFPGIIFFIVTYRHLFESKLSPVHFLMACIVFYSIFIAAFSHTEHPARLLGYVFDKHVSRVAEDLGSFSGIHDMLSTWVESMPNLYGRTSHYPPGNYISLTIERYTGVYGLYKSVLLLLCISCVPLIYYQARLFEFSRDSSLLAVVLFVLSPGAIIFPTTSLSSITVFFTLLTQIFLFRGLVLGKRRDLILAAATLFVYSMFSFIFFISILLYATFLFFLGMQKVYSFGRILNLVFWVTVIFIGLHAILYLVTGFNIADCLVVSIQHTKSSMTSEVFDTFERYLLRSTGNFLGYIGFSVSIIFPLILFGIRKYHLFSSTYRAYAAGLLASILLASFSTLFFLETARIWVFFTPAACLVAAPALYVASDKAKAPEIIFPLLLGLFLSSGVQELTFKHHYYVFIQ